MSLIITNIQRFCLHDGPGIRTTVFLKGCLAHCPWCANPETVSFGNVYSYRASQCVKQDSGCIFNNLCPFVTETQSALQKCTQDDVEKCKIQALTLIGQKMQDDDIVAEILKDKDYYGDTGGVTFSGGEPLLQTDSLLPVLKKLREYYINITIESSLFVPCVNVVKIIPYVDQFIVDVKVLTAKDARRVVGIDVKDYIENLKIISNSIDMKDFLWRFPVVPGITDTAENLALIKKNAKEFHIEHIEIFSVHNLAREKYCEIGHGFEEFNVASDERLDDIKSYLESNTCNVRINKI